MASECGLVAIPMSFTQLPRYQVDAENKHCVNLISFSIRTESLWRERCDFCSLFSSTAPRLTDLLPLIPTAFITCLFYTLPESITLSLLTHLVRILAVSLLRRRITPNVTAFLSPVQGTDEHKTVDKGILTPFLRQMFTTPIIKIY